MNRVFQPFQIKYRAKKAMRGNFLVALGASILPLIIITALSLCVLFVPAVRESLELITSGSFDTKEAQMDYIMEIYSNLLYATNLVLALFNFLVIGGERVCLDIIKGRKTSLKKLFGFYGKWYIALIWPLAMLVLSFGADVLVDFMYNINMNNLVIEIFLFFYELLTLFITFKTVFISTALADNDCNSFTEAFKTSWKMTNFKTVMSIFLLYISFIGWFILIAFTVFPIIYVYPYFRLSVVALYQSVKEEGAENS